MGPVTTSDDGPCPSLTPLALSALSVLREGPRHPYDIFAMMKHRHEDRVVKLRASCLCVLSGAFGGCLGVVQVNQCFIDCFAKATHFVFQARNLSLGLRQ